MQQKRQYKRLRIWGMALLLSLGAIVTPAILSNDTFAMTPDGIIATSSNSKSSSSKSNSSQKSTKKQQESENNQDNDAEAGYADPQGVKKSFDKATEAFSTGLTVLVVVLVGIPVLGAILFIIYKALRR